MLNYIQRELIKAEIKKKINSLSQGGHFRPLTEIKKDLSIVTEVDVFVSDLIKSHITDKSICYYSEEDHDRLDFPAIILDPIDGTIEFAQGIPECALSFASMPTENIKDGEAWIYNPFTGFEITTDIPFVSTTQKFPGKMLGLVSRSEWQKGLYDNYDQTNLIIGPRGSVANKLGLLAAGACDFVVSKKPKSIWDIAAGTILCEKRGFSFYENGQKVDKLTKERFQSPMIWCQEKDYIKLSSTLNLLDKNHSID